VDAALHEALRNLAEEDVRSIHSEILWILRQYIDQREAEAKKEAARAKLAA
jgi:hypothetical protein